MRSVGAGQEAQKTVKLAASRPTFEERHADAQPGTRAHAARADRQPQERARVITCPHCSKRLAWRKPVSSLSRCPRCRKKFVVLVERDGSCAGQVENSDSVADMICDWLDEERPTRTTSTSGYRDEPGWRAKRSWAHARFGLVKVW